MVRGLAIAVTAVAPMYQCADTTRSARGFGSLVPMSRHAFVYRFDSSVFIGLPWPMNSTGMRVTAWSFAATTLPHEGAGPPRSPFANRS